MTLLDRVFALAGYVKASPSAPSWALGTADQAKWNMPDMYMARNQEDLYRKLSWLQIAVNLISSSCASVPLGVYKRQGEDKEPVGNHPLELLLQSPNELDSDHDEFMEASFAYYLLTGNAYWWVNAPSPASPPDELWVVPPEKLTPIPDGKQYLKGYEYRDGTYQEFIPVSDIIHFKRFNPLNRFVGLSPIGAIANAATGDLAMSQWNTEFFAANNAKPSGLLTFQNEPVDWDRLRSELRREHGGTSRNFFMMKNVPKDAINYLQFGVSQKDMEFLAGRQFNREEIFQLYGVPMGLMSENATEANSTVAGATFNEKTLWPLLTRFAGKVTSKLLPRYGQGLVAEYDDIRVTDRQMELEERKTWSLYRTVDELREADDLDSIDDARKEAGLEPIGKLLVAEVQTASGGKPPEPVPQELQGLNVPPSPEEPTDEMETQSNPDNATPDMPIKAAPLFTSDLRLWRKKSLRMFALKGTGVCGFASDTIPSDVRNKIAYSLAGAGDTGAIKAIFDSEVKAVEGEQTAEIVELASAIRRAAATIGTQL